MLLRVSVERNIAREARERAEYAQMVRDGKRLPKPQGGISLPLSRSIPTWQQWPLDVVTERDLPAQTEFERSEAKVLARQVLAAPKLDDTDRAILRAIVQGDSSMTIEEIATEADISRTTLWRRCRALEGVVADLLGRETPSGKNRDTR